MTLPSIVVSTNLLNSVGPSNGKDQARRDLRAVSFNSTCPTKPNRAAIQGREAASPAAGVGAAMCKASRAAAELSVHKSSVRISEQSPILFILENDREDRTIDRDASVLESCSGIRLQLGL